MDMDSSSCVGALTRWKRWTTTHWSSVRLGALLALSNVSNAVGVAAPLGTLWFIKQRFLRGVRTQGFISQNIFWRTQNLAFGRTYTFSNDPTHSFINETPADVLFLCLYQLWQHWVWSTLIIKHIEHLNSGNCKWKRVYFRYADSRNSLQLVPSQQIERKLRIKFHTILC